jgi:hypothetical protein
LCGRQRAVAARDARRCNGVFACSPPSSSCASNRPNANRCWRRSDRTRKHRLLPIARRLEQPIKASDVVSDTARLPQNQLLALVEH